MLRSESIDALAPALVAAQAAITPAEKDGINPHFGRKYASLGAIMAAVRPALAAHGLAVSQIVTHDGDTLALETILVHTSGQYIGGTYPLRPTKADPQGEGSALTYARRYALAGILGVVADDDDDGNAASRQNATRSATKPADGRKVVKPPTSTAKPAPSAPQRDDFDDLPGHERSAYQPAGNGKAAVETETRPDWHNPDEAKAWAMSIGAFDHAKHCDNAYDKLRREALAGDNPPTSAAEFFDLWYADVVRRLNASLDKQAAAETPRF